MMMGEMRWQMPDATTLVVEREIDGDTIRRTTYSWNDPPSTDVVLAALTDPNENVTAKQAGAAKQAGQGQASRRVRLPFGLVLYLHHLWGPPRWLLPRIFVRANGERTEIAAGWQYHCFGLTVARDSRTRER